MKHLGKSMKDYSNSKQHHRRSSPSIACGYYFIYLYLSCQNWNFKVCEFETCEISNTTVPIELKLSGIIEGVNKLAVLKFQSNPIRLGIKSKIRNSG